MKNEDPIFLAQSKELLLKQHNGPSKAAVPSHRRLDNSVPFEKSAIEQSIPERFEKIVQRFPNRTAVKYMECSLAYRELDRISNRLASTILNQFGEASEPVAFLCEQGVDPVIVMLGITKAGKFYVPLDLSYPEEINASVLSDLQARLLVTNNVNIAQTWRLVHQGIRIINIDDLPAEASTEDPRVSISPDTFANIYYTSGSTDRPKGVIQNHRNVLHFMWTIGNTWDLNTDDRFAQLMSVSFAASMKPIWGSLLHGGTVLPYDLKKYGTLHLAEWISQERISLYLSVPSVFRNLVETLTDRTDLSGLRFVILTGEALYRADVELYRAHFPDRCLLHNFMASTEMHYIRGYVIDKRAEISGNIVPVGFGVQDKDVYLLDENGQQVGSDEIGEIVVQSRYLSPGYWRQTELTESVFLPVPGGGEERIYMTKDLGRMNQDGCLTHLGRKDSMVKIRGQRVEIGTVEKALFALDMVREAAVIAREDSPGHTFLSAYVVPRTKNKPTVEALRRQLRETLPEYMIPSVFTFLENLPKTSNDKVDRRSLPKVDNRHPDLDTAYVAPRDELEERLVKICERESKISPIGIRDIFFDLGIDSIQCFCIFIAIHKEFEKEFQIDAFFQMPTIEHMGDILRRKIDSVNRILPTAVAENRSASWTPSLRGELPVGAVEEERANRFRLFVVNVLSVILPWHLGKAILSWLCGNRLIQNTLFRKEVRLLLKYLASVDYPGRIDASLVKHNLQCNFLRTWRMAALSRMTDAEFDRYVQVSGIDELYNAHRNRIGVVLVTSHFSFYMSITLLLQRLKFEDVIILGLYPRMIRLLGLEKWEHVTVTETVSAHPVFGPKSLYRAITFLERGGIVHMAPDGLYGSSGIILPILGRMHHFRAGFAELAVSSGAAVVPVFATLDPSGKLVIEFLPSLDTGSPEKGHGERVDGLIREYAGIHEKMCRRYPQNTTWMSMRRFFDLPKAKDNQFRITM